MPKINKHIEIVRSSIPSLSSMGQKSCYMIRDILEKYYERVGITIVNNENDLGLLVIKKPDLVFSGLKNLPSTHSLGGGTLAKVWLSACLDGLGLSYTGSRA